MAYRFAPTSAWVKFAVAPFNGYTFGPFTVAWFAKRAAIGGSDQPFQIQTSAAANKVGARMYFDRAVSFNLGGTSDFGPQDASSTSTWYLCALTVAGTGTKPRFHVHNGTAWNHTDYGSNVTYSQVIGGTDLLYSMYGLADQTDLVCVGAKKTSSTDLQIETLSRTSFQAWRDFGFDWLIGYDTSLVAGGLLQDQASPGTGDEISRQGTITVVADPAGWAWAPAAVTPVADFTGTPLTGAPPLSVAFTDSSTNTPTSWAWTFGDGGTSTVKNPSHSYAAAGTYTVALVATNSAGSNTKTRTGYVTVAVPQPQGVCIAFSDPWDNPNPTWTRIDNVAGRRVRGYTIDRGRPNEFEKTGTGTATIRIADTIGTFDPTDPAAVGNVAPGKQACINLLNPTNGTWHTIFRGYVESWRYVLDQTRQLMEIELTLTDGFAILSRYELRPLVDGVLPGPPPYTSPPYATVAEADQQKKLAELAKGNVLYGETVAVTGQPTSGTVGDRILSVLGDAGWPYDLATNWIGFPPGTIPDIFSGNVRIGPKAYAPGTSALDALWDAADGEMPGVANLFMSRDGHVLFRGRQARFRPTVAQYGIVARPVGDPSAWAADATHTVVPVAELEFSHGEDNLYNSCTATPQGVGTGAAWRPLNPDPPNNDNVAGQLVTDTASIAASGPRGLTFDNLQTLEGKATGNNSMVETKLFSTYYVSNYKDPHPRISRLVFKTRTPTAQNAGALWELLCNAEISDLLSVVTNHPGAGGFAADFYIEGLHYQVTPGPPEHAVVELSLDVSPRAHWTTNPFTGDP